MYHMGTQRWKNIMYPFEKMLRKNLHVGSWNGKMRADALAQKGWLARKEVPVFVWV